MAGNLSASDVDGDSLTYSLVSGPAEGSVTVNADGSYSFDPGSDFQDLGVGETRDVSFTYEVADGQGGTDQASVIITVAGANDGPQAGAGSNSAVEDGGVVNGTLSASDVDGDSLTYSLVSGPSEGSVTVNADGSYAFDPGSDFQDLDDGETRDVSFTYEVADGQGGTDQASVTVTVTGVTDEESMPDPDIEGTSGDDTINGTSSGEVIAGYEGDDDIDAKQGDDTVYAGDGDDTVYGGQGDDTIYGEAGDDVLHGEQGHDTIYVGAGDDTAYAGTGNDTIYAGAGDDDLYGENGNDTFIFDLSAGLGDDFVDGGNGTDMIDLTDAGNWTVEYDNGDTFSNSDTVDSGLFTDEKGTITFENGDEVSFENVESFNW